MSLEEMAPYLVKDETIESDNPCYSSPSGSYSYNKEDAIEDCCRWLDSEYISPSLMKKLNRVDAFFDSLSNDEFEKILLEHGAKRKAT